MNIEFDYEVVYFFKNWKTDENTKLYFYISILLVFIFSFFTSFPFLYKNG